MILGIINGSGYLLEVVNFPLLLGYSQWTGFQNLHISRHSKAQHLWFTQRRAIVLLCDGNTYYMEVQWKSTTFLQREYEILLQYMDNFFFHEDESQH